MKKSTLALTLSMLAFSNCVPLYAQSGGDERMPGVVGGTAEEPKKSGEAAKSSVETENWPWMKEEKPKADNTPSFKVETPKAATLAPVAPHVVSPVPVHASTPPVEQHHTTTKLFGRIEQLSGGAGANFPIQLKAQTPHMDTRLQAPKKLTASANTYSGKVVSSFPTDYRGNWGGNLRVMQMQVDPVYYQIDPEEARRTTQALRLGTTGNVNFKFDQRGPNVALEPAQVMFMVPGRDTMVGEQVQQIMGGQAGGFGQMFSQIANNMEVPIMLNFGDVDTSASSGMETSLAGNQMRANVLRNDIRQLAPGVLEQQIVTKETTWDKRTHRQRTGYGESVIRFTSRNSSQMYVQAATISYSGSRQFLTKVMLDGWIQRGQVMQTNPMNAMGGMGGMGNLGDLQKMLGNPGGAQGGQVPQIPGFDPNMLKNLFGQ